MRQAPRALLLVVSALLPAFLSAHPITQGVGTQTFVYLFEDRIELRVNLGYSPNAGMEALLVMDTDGDGKVSPREKMAFLKAKGPELAKSLDVRVNGKKLTLELMRLSPAHGNHEESAPIAFG